MQKEVRKMTKKYYAEHCCMGRNFITHGNIIVHSVNDLYE